MDELFDGELESRVERHESCSQPVRERITTEERRMVISAADTGPFIQVSRWPHMHSWSTKNKEKVTV
jgi:hypothetical protein